jgi:DNA-binding MarR family transcriptional regulator
VTGPRSGLQSLTAALRQLVLAMEARRVAIANELEVGVSEVTAMEHLHMAGTLTPSDLGRRMALTSGSVTALLDRLERSGLILREPNPDDKRSVLLRATPVGRSAMHWFFEGFDATVASALQPFPQLPAHDVEAFVNMVTADLRRHDQPGEQ